MANDVAGRPWKFDTAGVTVVWSSWIKAAHFEFTGYGAQGNQCILKDQNGRVVWQATGAADLEEVRSGKVAWVNGLIIDTLQGGGKCFVYLD